MPDDATERALARAVGLMEPSTLVAVVDRAGPEAAFRPTGEIARATSYDAGDLDLLHLQLTAAGRHDLIVDLARGPRTLARLRLLAFHLRPGGRLVAVLPARAAARQEILDHAAELTRLREQGVRAPERYGDFRPHARRDPAAEAWSLEWTDTGDGVLEVTSSVATWAKVPENEMDRFLDLRPELGRVLTHLPGCLARSRCELRTGPADQPPAVSPTFDVPGLSLREYDDATFWTRQAATVDDVVVPASFRHFTRRRLVNKELREWAPRFVLEAEQPSRTLPGRWFLLDSFARGHFGHALTEQVALLWGWRLAKARDPGIRALVSRVEERAVAPWELELFEAGGIPREDLVMVDDPVRVERLVTATPMFVMPSYAHPDLLATYDEIGRRLAETDEGGRQARVFLTRRGRRSCHNADEVEDLFRAYGFEVLQPETLSLPRQVALVRGAEVVAGFAGSAMFLTMFAGRPQHVITVAPESYTASNEYLIASVLGHRLDRVLCRPDVPRGNRFSESSYHSDYTFDHDREGRFLRDVLARLDVGGPGRFHRLPGET